MNVIYFNTHYLPVIACDTLVKRFKSTTRLFIKQSDFINSALPHRDGYDLNLSCVIRYGQPSCTGI